MFREELATTQPVVFQTLQNALVNHHLAHAFLFEGPQGTPKLEAAYLLAQSLICPNDQEGFADETCSVCQRIKEGTYTDVMVFSGSETKIDDIRDLQEQFSKTALEEAGKKVYIIDQVEQTNINALNGLLKFLEEPNGDDTTAILITDSIDRLLPTIVSRCQIVPFKPMPSEHVYEAGKEIGLDAIHSYLLGRIVHNPKLMLETFETDEYQTAYEAFKRFIAEFDRQLYLFILDFETETFKSKDRDRNKTVFVFFLEMTYLFFRDVASGERSEDSNYNKQVDRVQGLGLDVESLMLVLLDAKNKAKMKGLNLGLLADETFYKIDKEVHA